jgi:uncharacterized MAPEG superfamily protein
MLLQIIAAYPRYRASKIAGHGDVNNAMKAYNVSPNGSDSLSSIKQSLKPREFAAYERAVRCHNNAMENMTLFVAAIFSSLLAEQKVGKCQLGLNGYIVEALGVRVLYTISYLNTEGLRWSYLRTGLFNVWVLLSLYQIGRAAFALG